MRNSSDLPSRLASGRNAGSLREILKGVSCSLLMLMFLSSCARSINTVDDPHFTKDGYPISDSLRVTFAEEMPSNHRFYIEVSGSMNGFFRANKPTRFKKDVWSVVSNFGGKDVYTLSTAGTVSGQYPVDKFRTQLNSGGFISSQETLVPTMLKSILSELDYANGECAVLISDMKYSPEKHKDINVLLDQYQTDIRNVIGSYPALSVSLILAKSDYLDSSGNTICEESPYYFLVMGDDSNVAFMRNRIATILDDNGDYGDCIESGFDYKAPRMYPGRSNNAVQLDDAPTYIGYDTEYSDTCSISIQVDLSDYRWIIADEDIIRECLAVRSCYGSTVEIGSIDLMVDNHFNKEFKRKAIADIELNISNMLYTDSDVIEVSLNQPESSVTEYFAQVMASGNESDYSGSFSVDRFIRGVFNAIQNKWDDEPFRILISKNE